MGYSDAYPRGYYGPAAQLPTLLVEVAWTTAPNSASPAWEDVSADVRSLSTTRGRSRELDRYQAGRMTVVLNNRTRAYDPTYTAGAHYGYVLPMRRIRARATYEGTTYPLFDGYIDSVDQEYDQPREATAVVSATDGFKVLAAAQLASSAYAQEVLADGPAHWWRLGEPSDQATTFDAVAGGADLAYESSPSRGETGLVSRETGTSVKFANASDNRARLDSTTAILSAYPFTAEFVLRSTAAAATIRYVINQRFSDGSSINIRLSSLSPGILVCSHINSAATVGTEFVSTNRLDDGLTHHVVIVAASYTSVIMYIDGVAASALSIDTAHPAFTTGQVFTVGNRAPESAFPFNFGFDGWLQEIAIYNSALSATRAAAHAAQIATPWNGDSPGTRFGRVLDAVNWPAALRDLDTGASTLQSATLAMTALEHLQKVADSEFGRFYVTADGKVRLDGRDSLLNRAELYTFGDDLSTELAYAGITFDYSDQLLRNSVTISRLEGVAQTVTDTTSTAAYLIHSYTADGLYHNSDDLSRYAAQFFVSESKDPQLRVTGLDVVPNRDNNGPSPATSLFPAVLTPELGDELIIRRRPQSVGTSIDQDVVIEGINHRVSPGEWHTRFTLSPAYTDDFLELDRVAGAGLDYERITF